MLENQWKFHNFKMHKCVSLVEKQKWSVGAINEVLLFISISHDITLLYEYI